MPFPIETHISIPVFQSAKPDLKRRRSRLRKPDNCSWHLGGCLKDLKVWMIRHCNTCIIYIINYIYNYIIIYIITYFFFSNYIYIYICIILWMVAKSCTTLDGWNPINNGMNHLSTGAGLLPSTVCICIIMYMYTYMYLYMYACAHRYIQIYNYHHNSKSNKSSSTI